MRLLPFRTKATFRPAVEALDSRVMPALLSVTAPVQAVAAVSIAPLGCGTPAVDVGLCVNVNLQAAVGATGTTLGSLAPINVAPVVGQVTSTLGGIINQVGGQVGTDLNSAGSLLGTNLGSVGGLVTQVGHQASIDVGSAGTLVDSIVTGAGAGTGSLPVLPVTI